MMKNLPNKSQNILIDKYEVDTNERTRHFFCDQRARAALQIFGQQNQF